MDGHFDPCQDWWPQTEAVIDFYDANQKSKNEMVINASRNCLDLIIDKMIDYVNGEWFWSVDLNGDLNIKEDKAGPWKAPNHNTRMCFEMIDRLKKSII